MELLVSSYEKISDEIIKLFNKNNIGAKRDEVIEYVKNLDMNHWKYRGEFILFQYEEDGKKQAVGGYLSECTRESIYFDQIEEKLHLDTNGIYIHYSFGESIVYLKDLPVPILSDKRILSFGDAEKMFAEMYYLGKKFRCWGEPIFIEINVEQLRQAPYKRMLEDSYERFKKLNREIPLLEIKRDSNP